MIYVFLLLMGCKFHSQLFPSSNVSHLLVWVGQTIRLCSSCIVVGILILCFFFKFSNGGVFVIDGLLWGKQEHIH